MEGCKSWLGFFIELYFFGCKILVEDVTTMSRYDFRPGISDEVPLARRRRLRLWGGDGSVREECNGGNDEYGGEGGDGGGEGAAVTACATNCCSTSLMSHLLDHSNREPMPTVPLGGRMPHEAVDSTPCRRKRPHSASRANSCRSARDVLQSAAHSKCSSGPTDPPEGLPQCVEALAL